MFVASRRCKMAKFVLYLALSFASVNIILAHGDHDHEKSNETPQEKTHVKVNVPNFLNIFPDFDKLFSDFDFGSSRSPSNEEKEDTPIRKHLKKVRHNYQNLRTAVRSALNIGDEDSDLFAMDLSSKGPKTKLNINSPLAQLSLEGKSRDKPKEKSENSDGVEPVSQKPLNEYMTDIIRDQAKRFDDFTLNLLGPRKADGEANSILSISNKGGKTNVEVTAPVLPVRLSMASQGGFSTRNGHFPEHPAPFNNGREESEDYWDPEEEYNHLVDNQKEKYLQMRSHGFQHSEPHSAPMFPPPPATRPKPMYPYHDDPHHAIYRPHSHATHSQVHPHEAFPVIPARLQMLQPFDPYWSQHFVHRGHHGLPQYGQPHPASNLPIQNYHDHRFMAPNFSQGGQGMDARSEPNILEDEDEQDNYEEYIKDLQEASNSLNDKTKIKLREAFKVFRKTLDEEVTETDLQTSQDSENELSWLPRRVVDHRDLEVAFLNIDKDSDERPNPDDKVVLAFTLTGVPIKIYMGSSIQNPVKHLHEVLAEAGITLTIPVTSYETMEPVRDVLFVGAGNKGNDVSEAVSLEVQNLDDIKKSVRRFLKIRNQSGFSDEDSSKELTEALHEALTSGELKFSEALQENFQRNPVQVLADVVTYLSEPLKGNDQDNHES